MNLSARDHVERLFEVRTGWELGNVVVCVAPSYIMRLEDWPRLVGNYFTPRRRRVVKDVRVRAESE